MVNASQTLFNPYHNEIPVSGSVSAGGLIALRFIGGINAALPSPDYFCRDGYGAKDTAALGEMTVIRGHRCGDGVASQHAATMTLGIGSRNEAVRVTLRWPSGGTTVTENVPEGTLLAGRMPRRFPAARPSCAVHAA